MGWGTYIAHGRPAGYLVEALCDQPGCTNKIDRGLGYLCGTDPWADDGCHGYFCPDHEFTHVCDADEDS